MILVEVSSRIPCPMTLEQRYFQSNLLPELVSATLGAILWLLVLAPRAESELSGLVAVAAIAALLRVAAWGLWLVLRGPERLVQPFNIAFGRWARAWLALSAILTPLFAAALAFVTLDFAGLYIIVQSLLIGLAGAPAAILWARPRSRLSLRDAGLPIELGEVRDLATFKSALLCGALVFSLSFNIGLACTEQTARTAAAQTLDERAAALRSQPWKQITEEAPSWSNLAIASSSADGRWQDPRGAASVLALFEPSKSLLPLHAAGLACRVLDSVSADGASRPASLLMMQPAPSPCVRIALGSGLAALSLAALFALWLSDQARIQRDTRARLLAAFQALGRGELDTEPALAADGEAEGEAVFQSHRDYLRSLHQGLEALARGSQELPSSLEGPGFLALRKLLDRTRQAVEALDRESTSFDELGKDVLTKASKTEKEALRQSKRFEQLGEMATKLSQDATRLSSSGQELYDSARKSDDTARALIASVSELHTKTTRIRDVIAGIERISKQSRMLALNIEIESRKGITHAADKGFTAIAAETRRLSDEVHSATVVATALLAEIDLAVAKTRDAVEGNKSLVGSTLVIAQEITRTSHEQTKASRAMNSRIKKTSEDIEGSAEAVQAVRQNIEQLTQRSKVLVQALQPLRGEAFARPRKDS